MPPLCRRIAGFGAAAVVALLGCEPSPATQVLVHFDAETESRARADGLRIRVWNGEGQEALDLELAFGEGDPPAQLPVTLPLIPKERDARRTFAVEAMLLEDGRPFSTQRLAGGYLEAELVHVHVRFDDACADRPPCPSEQTCVDGACVDACRSPAVDRCPTGATPCGECTERTDGGCVPAPEGTACSGGTCRGGACCTGCWDGAACQPGDGADACGIAGSGCFRCRCPSHGCAAGACAIPEIASAVWAGGHSTCALGPAGQLWCWGDGAEGALGTGDLEDERLPVRLGESTWGPGCRGNAPGDACDQVAVGWGHACAIDDAGALWCWGENDHGEAGVGTMGDPLLGPTRAGEPTWSRIAAGNDHACGVRADGSLWCWGHNGGGRLGLGDVESRPAPTRVGEDSDWAMVSASTAFTCALKSDASLWCWGGNFYGQLGTGDTSQSRVPVPSGGDRRYVALATGDHHACAVAEDRSLWCWGRSHAGQVAGVVDKIPMPTRVGMESDWMDVGAGRAHTCGLRADGTLWCWGENNNGQLGQGNTMDLAEPTRVGSDTDWASVVAGTFHTCATKRDGTVWCWGDNGDGETGAGGGGRHGRPRGTCLPAP